MMIFVLQSIILIVIGIAGGLAVGSGFVAFITVLDIIPRLTHMIKGFAYIRNFQQALITGTVFFTLIDFLDIRFFFPIVFTVIFGTFSGIFVGMLAGALTEVVNVLPILAKRLNMVDTILFLLMAMVLGKVAGSLFHWIIYVK